MEKMLKLQNITKNTLVGGKNEYYKNKYLKYKNKYMKLKLTF
jgi:hypothetical protein